MESIGEFFRQVRETKGLTVDEVASKTRIRSDFVKALEEGNFAKLPDQVFARGFVRSYARSLGLDEEDAIHRFAQSAGSFYDKHEERERLRQHQVKEERRKKQNRRAVAVAIGVAILTLVWLLSREQPSTLVRRAVLEPPPVPVKRSLPVPQAMQDESQARSTQSAASPSSRGPVKAPEVSETPVTVEKPPALPPMSASKPSVPAQPLLGPPPTPSTASGADGPLAGLSVDGPVDSGEPLVLDLEATELSWVVVQVDSGSPQEALLRPGERLQWKGQDQFIVTLGNAGGVRAQLDGKPQKPFGPSGKVVRDVVLKR